MRQRAKFWSWRACMSLGRMVQLAIIGFVIFIGLNAIADAMHKPIIADRVQQQTMPTAHAR